MKRSGACHENWIQNTKPRTENRQPNTDNPLSASHYYSGGPPCAVLLSFSSSSLLYFHSRSLRRTPQHRQLHPHLPLTSHLRLLPPSKTRKTRKKATTLSIPSPSSTSASPTTSSASFRTASKAT